MLKEIKINPFLSLVFTANAFMRFCNVEYLKLLRTLEGKCA